MHSELIKLELSNKWFRLSNIEYFCTGISQKGNNVIVYTNLRTFVWLYESEYDGILVLDKKDRPKKIPSNVALGNTFDITQTKHFELQTKKQLRMEYKEKIIEDKKVKAEKYRIRMDLKRQIAQENADYAKSIKTL